MEVRKGDGRKRLTVDSPVRKRDDRHHVKIVYIKVNRVYSEKEAVSEKSPKEDFSEEVHSLWNISQRQEREPNDIRKGQTNV